MLEKYEWILERYEELSQMIVQPEVLQDPQRYQKALQERSGLQEKVDAYHAYRKLCDQIQDARAMLDDPDLAGIAREELQELTPKKEEAEKQLQLYLLPPDPDAGRNVVMEIRSGAGGEEACLFAADLLRMYDHYCTRHRLRMQVVSLSDTDLGGIREVSCLITGPDAWSLFKYESGVHRVQRVPVTDSTGKKQTSTCTVAVLPEAEEVDITIDPRDIRMDVYRSTGHGGQCINTTDSAVRLTHIPSGMVVTCQDQKSQLRNRETAMVLLRSRLLEKMRSEKDRDYAENRRLQVGTGDRSERIRTYNFHESRVTDHRIGLTLYRISEIMDGDLDEIVTQLRTEEQARRLQQLQEA